MEYKAITISKVITVGENPHEDSLEEIKPYLEKGYKLVNVSCSHEFRPNTTTQDNKIQPTLVFIITTYFLSFDGESK